MEKFRFEDLSKKALTPYAMQALKSSLHAPCSMRVLQSTLCELMGGTCV